MNPRRGTRSCVLAVLLLLHASPAAWGAEGGAGEPGALEFFEKRIRPIFARNCHECHGPKEPKAHLRLDHLRTILKGGDSGPALVPGEPEKSRLIEAVRYQNVDLQMPPKRKLADDDIAALVAWVKMGAPWPQEPEPAGEGAGPGAAAGEGKEAFDLQKRQREHWAWQPLRPRPPPAVRDPSWPQGPLDRFVLAKLEENGLAPAPPAEKRTLIRRLSFDLLGLPPPPEDVEKFAGDRSPHAYERLVDRLLASPRFGERWARHWLDLVRYAETYGHEFDYAIHNAWRYRDYVIRAFNEDLPYDRFVAEHIAGDLLAEPRRHPAEGFNESVIGTGFFWLGEQTHSPVDVRQHQADVIDNQIDVLTKTFLGLTVACARCHDHKFDAISSRDYYALFGILESSRYRQAAIDPPERLGATARRLAELKMSLESLMVVERGAERALENVPPAERPAPAGPAVVFADFRRGKSFAEDGWLSDGEAFGRGPARAGEWITGGSAENPTFLFLRSGMAHSGALSLRLEGALRSPTFTIDRRYVHLLAFGSGGRINLVVDGFTLIRDPIYGGLKKRLESDQPAWITFDVEMWRGHCAYLELLDLDAPDPTSEAADGKGGGDGFLAVEQVLFSEEGPPVAPEGPAAIPLTEAQGEIRLPGEAASLLEEYRRLEAAIPPPAFAPAMTDGTGLDGRVFIRGSPKKLGEEVPRRFLEALSGAEASVSAGASGLARQSGRLELARLITDPARNPFLPRVMVNRVWHHLLGRGIVASVDNFGVQGDRPSHPELLDWLADELTRDGWSLKRLIRKIVVSSTYRMSASPAAAGVGARGEELDPANTLLYRARVRRLEGEAVRDAILAVSGRLDRQMFGPAVKIHLTPFMEGRGRPAESGPLAGEGRRSIYIEIRRNFLSPMMLAFDMPIPFSSMGARGTSNVPAQALILMNDRFVAEESQAGARRLLARADLSAEERIRELYLSALARPPAPVELDTALDFLYEQGKELGLAENEVLADLKPWADLCHVLLNVKEFLFID